MSPTFVLKGRRLFLVTGSPGGPTIINTVLQIITDVIDFRLSLPQAEGAGRFHHQWLPDKVRLEPGRFTPETTRQLRAMGYALDVRTPMGDAQTIEIDPHSGLRLGAADPRGSGAAVGY